MDDRDLLDRLRNGDSDAFDTLFRIWYPHLVHLAQAMLHDRSTAEEVVQDVMFELWRRREALVVQESIRAYLFQSTRNRALNHVRRWNVEKRGEPHAADRLTMPAHADASATVDELGAAITGAISSLPDRCREVFELSRVHGLRYAEIAEALGISVKTVEAQMGRALRTMRERLAPWLPGGDEG